MNRDQAVEIERHLKRAANAVRRAEILMWELDQEDRMAFAEPLGNTIVALNFDLRQVIYDRFPDIKPPSKVSRFLDSKLTWKQVELPLSVTEADVDAILLSILKPRSLKVARVIGDALKRSGELGRAISDQIFAARLKALADSGRIEGNGDLRKWRFSEVRLKG